MIFNKRMARACRHAPVLAVLALAACNGLPVGDGSPASGDTGQRAEDVLAARARRAAPPPAQAAATPGRAAALREGIKFYDDGDFNAAIRRLATVDVAGEAVGNRLIALKYMAFSYCVTAHPAPCRQAFDKALRLDPSFDLRPGEHSHPLWGPVFAQAKKAD